MEYAFSGIDSLYCKSFLKTEGTKKEELLAFWEMFCGLNMVEKLLGKLESIFSLWDCY